MNFLKKINLILCILLISACTNYNAKKIQVDDKIFYSSTGFALIYDDSLFEDGILNKKINNLDIIAIHSTLKKNTKIKIINPDNSKFVETKISYNSSYPKIFNLIITKKISDILNLNMDNPYIEFFEVKKNKTFVAEPGGMFDEEKQVATKVPVNDVKMDILTKKNITPKNAETVKKTSFSIIISDFYYFETANNLKDKIQKQTKINNISIKKIKENQHRLLIGPFKNFNALKSSYISLNNLGFDELTVHKE